MINNISCQLDEDHYQPANFHNKFVGICNRMPSIWHCTCSLVQTVFRMSRLKLSLMKIYAISTCVISGEPVLKPLKAMAFWLSACPSIRQSKSSLAAWHPPLWARPVMLHLSSTLQSLSVIINGVLKLY